MRPRLHRAGIGHVVTPYRVPGVCILSVPLVISHRLSRGGPGFAPTSGKSKAEVYGFADPAWSDRRRVHALNGTCFAVPMFEGKKHFQILSRAFSAEMSAEAAGISAMLTVLKCLTWLAWSENGNDSLTGRLNQLESALWEYALTLKECSIVCMAAD